MHLVFIALSIDLFVDFAFSLTNDTSLQVLNPKGTLRGCPSGNQGGVTMNCAVEGALPHTQALFGLSKEGESMVGYLFSTKPNTNIGS